jgi:CO/xanthine dehydrogenase Mo-binding subunit
MQISRREFVKLMTSSGIALSVSPATFAQTPAFATRETLPGRQSWNPAATGVGRIDGLAKVTGAKLYASDFRAADLPGWPANTSHAMLIRATDATHVFTGIDLSRLSGALKPSRVVTAADLATAGIRVPAFYAQADLFCPVGKTPSYLGQPLAMLIFEQFDAFDQARTALRDPGCVKYGQETGPVAIAPFGAYRFVRVAGSTPGAPDVYSPMQAGWVTPRRFLNVDLPVWAPASQKGPADAQASFYGEQIRAGLAASNPDQLMLDREFQTQSIDPMFLEPESGIAWYDPKSKSLELVVGVQSPMEATESVAYLLGNARGSFKPALIHTHCAYMGGGFGGRDHTTMPLYVALAAMFYPNRPVRLANNRYEQFQSGIKRHAFKMRSRMGVDRATGKIRAFAADHVLDGGGLANFSAQVATVGATGAIGFYDIPKVDISTVAFHSRAVTAGSMRGYGTTQVLTALEVLIDEAAVALRLDPIEFRRRNALPTNGQTMAGNVLIGVTRTDEVLAKLAKHPIWQDRATEKARALQQRAGILVGTGVACVNKDFGTGADACLASVELTPEGRITIRSDAVEMGTAIGTALANRVAALIGDVADEVAMAQVDAFAPLGLVTSGDPFSITQAAQDAASRNPRWVPEISSPSSASVGAHFSTHAAFEAARVIFRFGLWPAALDLWGIAKTDPRARQWDTARWQQRKLAIPGLPPLDLASVAAKAHARGGVTAAMVHGFNRWSWTNASFKIAGETYTADIDALAVRTGTGTAKARSGSSTSDRFVRLNRTSINIPPAINERIGVAYTSTCGTLVRIEIDRATGSVRIAKAYSVAECGQPLVPEVVVGQMQGGFAMGVGQALLETLPLYEDGPGNGKWNLGEYVVPRAADMPLNGLEIEVLPPLKPDDPPKGMAEVVMIPHIPAILNAIYDATGHRFQSLPVTQAMLKGVLK